MIIYLLKSSICLALLLAVYHLFLEKEKMHQFNRFYLLGSILFSFYAPYYIIYTEPIVIREAIEPLFTSIQEINLGSNFNNITTFDSAANNTFDFSQILIAIYIFISALLLFRFSKNLFKISNQIKKNKKSPYKNATVVLISEKVIPHTFLHYIFINKKEFKKNTIEDELFTHELTHVSQKHTFDILLIELLQIICWFNPLIIYLKKAIKLNHEFLADDSVIHSHKNTTAYQYLLLNKATLKNNSYLASNFNYSLTKKRLIMMTKQSSQLKMLLKKTAIIPLVIGLLFLFANRVEAQQKTIIHKTETTKVHQEKVTPEMIKEYNSLAKKMKTSSNGIFKAKDIERIKFIYNLMTDKQKETAESFPNIPPPPPPAKVIKLKNTPPPPPIPSNATEEQKKGYKKAIHKYKKSQKELKNIPPPPPPAKKSVKKNSKKLRVVNDAPPPPPIPAKATKEQKKAYKKTIEKYKKSQKELKNIPPPPPPISAKATKEQKKGYKKAIHKYKKSQKELKNIPPPPKPSNSTRQEKKAYLFASIEHKKSEKEKRRASLKSKIEYKKSQKEQRKAKLLDALKQIKSQEELKNNQPPASFKKKIDSTNRKTGYFKIKGETIYYFKDNGNIMYFNKWGQKVSKKGKILKSN